MMVRDAASSLERAVESVRPYVDEVCIIDTGSVDETPAIARRLADRYAERPWPDDFAEARNWTLDHATGRFVLILDADEYAHTDGGAWDGLRREVRDRNLSVLSLTVVNHLHDTKKSELAVQMRVLRRDERIRYRGAVHHDIGTSVNAYEEATGHRRRTYGATIIHEGYDMPLAVRRAKYRARLPLYDKALREERHPGRIVYYTYQLGTCYHMCGDHDAAILTLRRVLPLLVPSYAAAARRVICRSQAMLLESGLPTDHYQAWRDATEMLRYAPREPEELRVASRIALAVGQYWRAILWLGMSTLYADEGCTRMAYAPGFVEETLKTLQSVCNVHGIPPPETPKQVQVLCQWILNRAGAPLRAAH